MCDGSEDKFRLIREGGVCPHSMRGCSRSRQCVLLKLDSCYRLTSDEFTNCVQCRKANNGKCLWVCFRNFNCNFNCNFSG